jgi:hypothetical protein
MTSVAASPEEMGRWVLAAREMTNAAQLPVAQYVLDHAPGRWHDVHRDVHPAPLGLDAFISKTLKFAAAVRAVEPKVQIVAPVASGWSELFYRPEGAESSARKPWIPYFLKKVREAEAKAGKRLVDVVEVHWFPQGVGLAVGGAARTDPAAAAHRIRSTRSLWDGSYKDESWIAEPVRLLPRLKEWVSSSAPGVGISLGEYGFGAEEHMSGGLALAEALGRMAQANVVSAFHWKYMERGSPAYWAFRAYRNFDGQGARFETQWLPTTAAEGTSLFASRSPGGSRVVAVALNVDADTPARVSLQVPGCGTLTSRRVFTYAGETQGLVLVPATPQAALLLEETLPPYSISVFDLTFDRTQTQTSSTGPNAR